MLSLFLCVMLIIGVGDEDDVIAGSLQVDRVSYLLQEIYGIENKNNQETKVNIISCTIITW